MAECDSTNALGTTNLPTGEAENLTHTLIFTNSPNIFPAVNPPDNDSENAPPHTLIAIGGPDVPVFDPNSEPDNPAYTLIAIGSPNTISATDSPNNEPDNPTPILDVTELIQMFSDRVKEWEELTNKKVASAQSITTSVNALTVVVRAVYHLLSYSWN